MLDAATSPRIHTIPQDVAQPTIAPTPSGSRLGPRWFVIATYSQAERRAAQNLHDQGYETYLPLVTVRRRDAAIRSLLHRVDVPLFLGYAFVRFDALRDPWRPITNTPGVYRLLTNADGMPEPVARGVVSALQASADARRHQGAENALWAPGTPCSLRRGYAFEGLPAVVLEAADDRARIAVMFLGQLREISVDATCLVARDNA